MDGYLRQSTAKTVKIGPFLSDDGLATAETGLTLSQADIRLSKSGGDMAQKSEASACTHDELGYYDCPLDTTDTATLGNLKLMVHETGALPVWHTYTVLPANAFDSLIAGTDTLEADVALWRGAQPNALQSGRVDGYLGAVAAQAIAAASFAANALDAVWSAVERTLTSGANIALAKGTGVTGFNDLSAADVNAQVDAALADYDAPTKAELDASDSAVLAKLLKYVQLILRKDAAIATDNATELTAINANGGSGSGAYSSQTDSQEALRDRGDAAWISADISGLATPADVNEQVLDVLTVDTFSELAAPPGNASSLKDKIVWLFMPARHKFFDDSTTITLRNFDDTDDIATAPISDTGGVTTRGHWESS